MSFVDDVKRDLRGSYAVVVTEGERYTGIVKGMQPAQRHVFLKNAQDEDGNNLGTAFLTHVDHVFAPGGPTVESVSISEVTESPYNAQSWSKADNFHYLREVQKTQSLPELPTARRLPDGTLELVDGHKGVWVAGVLGFDTHPVEIYDEMSDWDATAYFVREHLPLEDGMNDHGKPGKRWPNDDEITEIIERIVDDWGERAFELLPIEYNVERLGLEFELDDR